MALPKHPSNLSFGRQAKKEEVGRAEESNTNTSSSRPTRCSGTGGAGAETRLSRSLRSHHQHSRNGWSEQRGGALLVPEGRQALPWPNSSLPRSDNSAPNLWLEVFVSAARLPPSRSRSRKPGVRQTDRLSSQPSTVREDFFVRSCGASDTPQFDLSESSAPSIPHHQLSRKLSIRSMGVAR